MAREPFYLVVDTTKRLVFCATPAELAPLLKKLNPMVIDMGRALDIFEKRVGPDRGQEYSINQIAELAGLTLTAARGWVQQGVIRPTHREGPGRSRQGWWSYKSTFLCVVLGVLTRQRVPQTVLRQIFEEVGEAGLVQESREAVEV